MNRPLEELDSIHASEQTKDKTLRYVLSQNHHNYKKLILIPIIVCAALFFFLTTQQQSVIQDTPIAYVSLDINPSLELRLNEDNIVIETVAYNKDAEAILKTINIQGEELQNALVRLLNDERYENYLNNGLLEVAVFAENQKISSQLEKKINTLLNTHLESDQYHCAQIDKETHHNASSHHMSGGKYRIIETIMSYTNEYSFEELNDYSIQKLYSLLYTFNQEEVPSGCQPGQNQDNHHQKHKHSK